MLTMPTLHELAQSLTTAQVLELIAIKTVQGPLGVIVTQSGSSLVVEFKPPGDKVGLLIGKGGRGITALRTVAKMIGHQERHVVIEILDA